jgi:hypothetical protein
MTSAANAVEKVSYNLLSDGNNIGAAVFQHVPQDTLPPVIIIGDIDVQPLALKDDPDRRISLTILTVTEAEERKSMLDLQDAIESRLDGARISHDGWIIAFTQTGCDAVLTPEGDGYIGTNSFTILALRA